MANRNIGGRVQTIEKGIVPLFMQVAIGATGAPTLSAVNSQGVRSISRNGAGDYTVTFGSSTPASTDTYNRYCGANFTLTDTTARDYTLQIHTESAIGTAGTLRFLFNSAAVTTELPNGATLKMVFWFKNSSVV